MGQPLRIQRSRASQAVEAAHEEQFRCEISDLRSRWGAGRTIAERKLLVECYDKPLNIARQQERTGQQCDYECRGRANVCGLADLASCLVLAFFVRVREVLGQHQTTQRRRCKSERSEQDASRFVLVTQHGCYRLAYFPVRR
jgi:hypothetical protein